jgi:hypothetical protein
MVYKLHHLLAVVGDSTSSFLKYCVAIRTYGHQVRSESCLTVWTEVISAASHEAHRLES